MLSSTRAAKIVASRWTPRPAIYSGRLSVFRHDYPRVLCMQWALWETIRERDMME